jgi:hypothetical protein
MQRRRAIRRCAASLSHSAAAGDSRDGAGVKSSPEVGGRHMHTFVAHDARGHPEAQGRVQGARGRGRGQATERSCSLRLSRPVGLPWGSDGQPTRRTIPICNG